MSRGLVVALAALLLAGCAAPPVMLRHPDGRVAKCDQYTGQSAFFASAEAMRQSQCISDFQRQGFERVPE
jgi:uncharacterized lipoprotein YajG